jgi:hypothetical protein
MPAAVTLQVMVGIIPAVEAAHTKVAITGTQEPIIIMASIKNIKI